MNLGYKTAAEFAVSAARGVDKGVALAFAEGFAGGCDIPRNVSREKYRNVRVDRTCSRVYTEANRNFVVKHACRGNGSKIVRDKMERGASCYSKNDKKELNCGFLCRFVEQNRDRIEITYYI